MNALMFCSQPWFQQLNAYQHYQNVRPTMVPKYRYRYPASCTRKLSIQSRAWYGLAHVTGRVSFGLPALPPKCTLEFWQLFEKQREEVFKK
jgi:hypothetical protein